MNRRGDWLMLIPLIMLAGFCIWYAGVLVSGSIERDTFCESQGFDDSRLCELTGYCCTKVINNNEFEEYPMAYIDGHWYVKK